MMPANLKVSVLASSDRYVVAQTAALTAGGAGVCRKVVKSGVPLDWKDGTSIGLELP